MIDDIYDYASDHPNFDTEFVDSLQEQLQKKKLFISGANGSLGKYYGAISN